MSVKFEESEKKILEEIKKADEKFSKEVMSEVDRFGKDLSEKIEKTSPLYFIKRIFGLKK